MASSSANVLVGVCSVEFPTGSDIGWCTDGVMLTVSTDLFDVKVEEVVGTLKRVVVDQSIAVVLNLAEGVLATMGKVIPASAEAGGTLTIGNQSLQSGELKLVGKNPAGFNRTITLSNVNPTGEVGIPYRKGEISIVPVTFSALVAPATGAFGTIVDAAA